MTRLVPGDVVSHEQINSIEEYQDLCLLAQKEPERFWREKADNELFWKKHFDKVLDWNEPHAEWFVGGKINASENCLDVHLKTHRRHKIALLWEGEAGAVKSFTYEQLHTEVCRFANVLSSLGISKGDVVAIYLSMVPELLITMLACARIGAIHMVIFSGFSAEAISDRCNDCNAKLIITADGGMRREKIIPLKQIVDAALSKIETDVKCIVVKHTGQEVMMQHDRDYWWHDVVESKEDYCPAVSLDSGDTLFVLHTSGSTDKPKGVVHATAGYLLQAKLSMRWVFGVRETDVYWCTADFGWITGHTYGCYGPLSVGATIFMYEGAPDTPNYSRWWSMIERYKISIFYTAPTAIRMFIKSGKQVILKHNLDSLRLLGSVGEGIDPKTWRWYHKVVGGGRCPIMDTWWQTETGAIMLSPQQSDIKKKPGSCGRPLPGIIPEIVGSNGERVVDGVVGLLTIKQPWPGMLKGIWKNENLLRKQYWGQVPHNFLTGDYAYCDKNGYFWIRGRVDDVINVSGHRLSAVEVEYAINRHGSVVESVAVAKKHEIKGEVIIVYVVLKKEPFDISRLKMELLDCVKEKIGGFAVPEEIKFVKSFPKTRSGKIMRRIIREQANGREPKGDLSALEN